MTRRTATLLSANAGGPDIQCVCVLSSCYSIARAQPPSQNTLEQQGLADLFGKRNLKGGHYYSYGSPNGGEPERLIWLPSGLTKGTLDDSDKVFMFYKGYDSFKVNCFDKGKINGVCIDGGNHQEASLKVVEYSLSGDNAKLVAKSPIEETAAVSMWGAPLTSEDAVVFDLGNGYTGVFVKDESSGQEEEATGNLIFLCRDGHIRRAGRILMSGDDEGAKGKNDPGYYDFNLAMTLGDAAPGKPKSIILTGKGTAPTGKDRAIEPFNKVAVYTFAGVGYSGPPLRWAISLDSWAISLDSLRYAIGSASPRRLAPPSSKASPHDLSEIAL